MGRIYTRDQDHLIYILYWYKQNNRSVVQNKQDLAYAFETIVKMLVYAPTMDIALIKETLKMPQAQLS